MGFFLRPKDTNRDRSSSNTEDHMNAEAIAVPDGEENEYIPTTGFDPTTDGISGAIHRRDPTRREAPPGSPLPTGSWRGAVSRTVSSGFGRGTRAGKSGARKG